MAMGGSHRGTRYTWSTTSIKNENSRVGLAGSMSVNRNKSLLSASQPTPIAIAQLTSHASNLEPQCTLQKRQLLLVLVSIVAQDLDLPLLRCAFQAHVLPHTRELVVKGRPLLTDLRKLGM